MLEIQPRIRQQIRGMLSLTLWGQLLPCTTQQLSHAGAVDSLLSSEVVRLQEEVAALRQRVQGYEVDVEQLVATSELGHANPRQKIQYHLRCSPPTLHLLEHGC